MMSPHQKVGLPSTGEAAPKGTGKKFLAEIGKELTWRPILFLITPIIP